MSTLTQAERVFNFSAGPAVLPVKVLEEAQKHLISLPGAGASILEISHRSPAFDEIIQGAEANLRKLLNIPENYHVLFLQGGASLQFSIVHFLGGKSADYVITGSWAKKAAKEAKREGTVNAIWNGEGEKYTRMPYPDELKVNPDAAYVHITSNETIEGISFPYDPDTGNVPLVCDSSSDILSRPVDIAKYGLIYAGAQKNMGPAGCTLVIIRDDLLQRQPENQHTMLDYKVQAENKSLYNTPPVFTIYIMGLVYQWILNEFGGLEGMLKQNREKAGRLYEAIDNSGGFYKGHAQPQSRSMMNVTFRLPSEDLEKQFVKEAKAAKLDGLKGHRSVGGLRASIYNAFPPEGVDALIAFMKEFRQKNG